MSKMKQIAALTAMLVGVIMYASPAKSAVCFLPDDDGNCGGGDIEISDDSTSENQCADFNLSQNQRNSKEYDSDCYSCEPCTYNSRTTYKCALKNGATWYGGNLSVCCTNGEKYDSAEGKCCPAGGCVHECDAPKEWNSTSRRCVCPSGVETTTGVCCNDSEHADGAICCPEKKHNEGGVCKCDSQYNTDKNGNCVLPVEKNCVDINKDYKNKNQVSQCENYEPVKGISAADGPCYTCEDKPIDKCVDIEATPFLDIIEPTVTTVKASGEVKEVNATLECGINPKKAYKYEINIITTYDSIKLPVKRIKPVEYRYRSGSLPGYYYKTNIDGKDVCITDSLCTQYAKEGKYISAYEIFIKNMSVDLDRIGHKIYCCKTDDNFSGDSLSHLYSSCKEALPFSEPQHIDKYTGVYFDPVYVCDKGVKEGTKCKIGSYSCPKDYKLSGDNCVKKECPKGYVLTSDNGKDVCVNPTYTCPTDGKYKYKLSGNKCVCDTSKTCSEISNGSWKGEKDKNTCPTGYKPEVVESTIGATAFSDGPCYKCEYDGKSCSQLYEGSSYSDKCSTNEIATTVGKDEAGKNCYTCSKCYRESSSGEVKNKSTIYYFPEDEPYIQGECASEMTINVACDNTNLKAKLYVNGKETQANPNSYENTEGKWFGDFMNCTGCATVECTFKYGDKTKITIPQTGGPGD
ncbi:MAG: hypothetical protein MSB80_05205 [Alphaproteobacteria bacterium]|nr:hypothetical protein [Alphaproteobacteria bacterium]